MASAKPHPETLGGCGQLRAKPPVTWANAFVVIDQMSPQRSMVLGNPGHKATLLIGRLESRPKGQGNQRLHSCSLEGSGVILVVD